MQQVASADRSRSDRAASDRPRPAKAAQARELDDEDYPRAGRVPRFDDSPPRPWWRPASTAGRVFLGLGALILVGGFTTCIVLLRNFLDHDARFRIEGAGNIQATGLAEVSRTEMLPVFGEDIGRNIFFVPLAERRKQLEQIPWVEHATVMRFLPDQIRVSVVERQPVAFARNGQQVGLVDANGVLLTMPASMMAQHHYSFPVLTGIDPRDSAAGRRERMAVYERLVADLDSGGQKISSQISEIDLTNPEDARILMPEPGGDILAHFGDDHFLERWKRYKTNIDEWRQQHPTLAAVDLRYDSQVVLKMAGDTQAAASTMAMTGASGSKPAAGQPVTANDGTTDAAPHKSSTKDSARARERKKADAARAKKKRAEHHPAQTVAQNAGKTKPHAAAAQGQ
jgi:cell division protein FtsQ